MKCIILAAGYATRLYPLTENFPKPLLKVGDKTILDWLIDDISTAVDGNGNPLVEEYIVISNHKYAGIFEDWAENGSHRIRIVDDGTDTNETRLGAVKDIQFAIDELKLLDEEGSRDGVLVIAGDNVLDFSLRTFIEYAADKKTSCIMRYYEASEERLHKTGVAEINADDLIIHMEEKPKEPKSHWCCPPFYFYTKADARLVQKGIDSGCGTDAPGSYIAWLSTVTPVHAMEMPGSRYDIGNLESYHKVCADYKGITK